MLTHSLLMLALAVGFVEGDEAPAAPAAPTSALEASISALQSDKAATRVAAARAIGKLGSKGEPAIPALVAGLADARWTDDDVTVSGACASALARIGKPAVPAALEALRSDDLLLFTGGAATVNEMSPPPAAALELLRGELNGELHAEDSVRLRIAIIVIGAFGPSAEPAVPQLVEALDHENMHVRYLTCMALGKIGPKAAAAVPRMLKILADDLPSPRGHAALGLGSIGTVPEHDVVAALLVATQDVTSVVRERALVGLGMLGRQGAPALPALREQLADTKSRHRVETAFSVWQITGEPDASVEVLVALADDFEFNLEAIRTLGEMGPAAKSAVPKLVERLDHADPDVRFEAIRSLVRIDPQGSRRHVEQAAKEDPDADVRAVAAESLATTK